ncbi:MAG: hypothetical protein EXS36_16360 [Pedosphaera sp.]|nr:hypothetical protein [Pedosphaera sp.]
MHYVANVNADLDLDAPVVKHIMIALGQRALNFDAALRLLERAVAHHVGKHDRGQLALFGAGGHGTIEQESTCNSKPAICRVAPMDERAWR